ncbi:uncharacterized protein BJ171DRAFT_240798 [Polychytrium aggregatum]|uniref:uncharacterized protein n=1 Tax=Polychytrium aggregatum TaxID=110093 RepID=UPI0022FE4EE2|nr:uncharacterized protein BJ171DRAFT_240798 [Polychytrium aggregatum]KAI9197138.1 hypothetical protein BJ171DRAFT_240798 [Polychytrium aggregatum]
MFGFPEAPELGQKRAFDQYQHQSKPLWKAVREGNFDEFCTHAGITPEQQTSQQLRQEIQGTGVEGETLLHAAILHCQDDSEDLGWHKIATALICNDEGLVNRSYANERYKGETPLHLAAAKNRFHMFELLVANGAILKCCFEKQHEQSCKCGALKDEVFAITSDQMHVPNVKATAAGNEAAEVCVLNGHAFRPDESGGFMYYGKSALAFAAVAGSIDILKKLLNMALTNKAVSPSCRIEGDGNTVLHILAYWGLFSPKNGNESSWDIIVDYCDTHYGRDSEYHPFNIRNKDGMTPFLVGIHRGHVGILDTLKVPLWEFGISRSYMFRVDEIDTWRDKEFTSSDYLENQIALMNDKVSKGPGKTFSGSAAMTNTPSSQYDHQAVPARSPDASDNPDASERVYFHLGVKFSPTIHHKSAIQMAIDGGFSDILVHPIIHSVLRVKWETHVRRTFVFDTVIHIVFIISFSAAFLLLPSHYAEWPNYLTTTGDPGKTAREYARAFLEAVTIILVGFMFLREVACTTTMIQWPSYKNGSNTKNGAAAQPKAIWERVTSIMQPRRLRPRRPRQPRRTLIISRVLIWYYTFTTWTLVFLTTAVVLIRHNVFTFPDLSTQYHVESILIGFLALVGWLRSLYYAIGFANLGTLVVAAWNCITKDLVSWSIIYGIAFFSSAQIFSLQMRNSAGNNNPNATHWTSASIALLSQFGFLFGQGQPLDDFSNADDTTMTLIFYLVYQIITAILLLNLFIAMLNKTFMEIYERSETAWHYQWTVLVTHIDSRVPSYDINRRMKFSSSLIPFLWPSIIVMRLCALTPKLSMGVPMPLKHTRSVVVSSITPSPIASRSTTHTSATTGSTMPNSVAEQTTENDRGSSNRTLSAHFKPQETSATRHKSDELVTANFLIIRERQSRQSRNSDHVVYDPVKLFTGYREYRIHGFHRTKIWHRWEESEEGTDESDGLQQQQPAVATGPPQQPTNSHSNGPKDWSINVEPSSNGQGQSSSSFGGSAIGPRSLPRNETPAQPSDTGEAFANRTGWSVLHRMWPSSRSKSSSDSAPEDRLLSKLQVE